MNAVPRYDTAVYMCSLCTPYSRVYCQYSLAVPPGFFRRTYFAYIALLPGPDSWEHVWKTIINNINVNRLHRACRLPWYTARRIELRRLTRGKPPTDRAARASYYNTRTDLVWRVDGAVRNANRSRHFLGRFSPLLCLFEVPPSSARFSIRFHTIPSDRTSQPLIFILLL